LKFNKILVKNQKNIRMNSKPIKIEVVIIMLLLVKRIVKELVLVVVVLVNKIIIMKILVKKTKLIFLAIFYSKNKKFLECGTFFLAVEFIYIYQEPKKCHVY